MPMFDVFDDSNKAVRVRASSFEVAAIRGATKLGMRWMKRRPSTVKTWGGYTWAVYGPHDNKSGGQHKIGQVRVIWRTGR